VFGRVLSNRTSYTTLISRLGGVLAFAFMLYKLNEQYVCLMGDLMKFEPQWPAITSHVNLAVLSNMYQVTSMIVLFRIYVPITYLYPHAVDLTFAVRKVSLQSF